MWPRERAHQPAAREGSASIPQFRREGTLCVCVTIYIRARVFLNWEVPGEIDTKLLLPAPRVAWRVPCCSSLNNIAAAKIRPTVPAAASCSSSDPGSAAQSRSGPLLVLRSGLCPELAVVWWVSRRRQEFSKTQEVRGDASWLSV